MCDVQMMDNEPVIAVLGEKKGTINIWTRNQRTFDQACITVPAHESEIECFCLSQDGKLLATASGKGSIIRVFTTSTGQCIGSIRRGRTYAKIVNLEYWVV